MSVASPRPRPGAPHRRSRPDLPLGDRIDAVPNVRAERPDPSMRAYRFCAHADMVLEHRRAISAGATSMSDPHHRKVDLEVMSTAELLDAWRDASRAAELAERLAELARAAAIKGDRDANTAHEIATLAEEVAASAERAAQAARDAARTAADEAGVLHAESDRASEAASNARASASEARDEFHHGEADARTRYPDDPI